MKHLKVSNVKPAAATSQHARTPKAKTFRIASRRCGTEKWEWEHYQRWQTYGPDELGAALEKAKREAEGWHREFRAVASGEPLNKRGQYELDFFGAGPSFKFKRRHCTYAAADAELGQVMAKALDTCDNLACYSPAIIFGPDLPRGGKQIRIA